MKAHLLVCLAGLAMFASCASQTEIQSEVTTTPAAQPTEATSPTARPSPTAQPSPTQHAVPTPSAESLIMLQDPLDEPEFYCVDVAGFGSSLNLDAPLQAHTCKPGADDELFTYNHPGPGQFSMDAYDVCLEAGEGVLYVRACSDSPKQRFALSSDGTLRLQDSDLCVAVQSGEGQPAGGRSHVRRDLLLQSCSDVEENLSRWVLPGPRP